MELFKSAPTIHKQYIKHFSKGFEYSPFSYFRILKRIFEVLKAKKKEEKKRKRLKIGRKKGGFEAKLPPSPTSVFMTKFAQILLKFKVSAGSAKRALSGRLRPNKQ